MEQRFDKIEKKIDKIQDSVHSIDVTMGKQHESLVQHMNRTQLLEKLVFMAYAAIGALALYLLQK